jgi:hypothetical protein
MSFSLKNNGTRSALSNGSRGRTRRRLNPRSNIALDYLEIRQLMTVAPSAIGTIGLFSIDRIQKVSTSTGEITYVPSSNPDQYAGWLFLQDSVARSFGIDGKNLVFEGAQPGNGDTYGFNGTTAVGGASFVQSQFLAINALSGGAYNVSQENEFNNFKTLAQFPASSLPNPADGPIYLDVTASQAGAAGETVGVGWTTSDGTAIDSTKLQGFYNNPPISAGTITLDGGTSYKIDVTQAVADFLKQNPSSNSNLVFLLSPQSSGMELSGVNAELDDTPPPPLPDISVTDLGWAPDHNGVQFSYMVSGSDLPAATNIQLFWSDSPTFGTGKQLAVAGGTFPISQETGSYGPIGESSKALGTPPDWTRYLLAVADPNDKIEESDKANNVASMVPVDIALTSASFGTDSVGSPALNYHVDLLYGDPPAPFTIGFYLTKDDNLAEATLGQTMYQTSPGVAGHYDLSLLKGFLGQVFPADYLFVVANPNASSLSEPGPLNELDPTNDSLPAIPLPDLVVKNLAATSVDSQLPLTATGHISVSAMVANTGPGQVGFGNDGKVVLDFKANQGTLVVDLGRVNATVGVPVSVSYDLGGRFSPGPLTITATADPDDTLLEPEFRGNNSSVTNVTIAAPVEPPPVNPPVVIIPPNPVNPNPIPVIVKPTSNPVVNPVNPVVNPVNPVVNPVGPVPVVITPPSLAGVTTGSGSNRGKVFQLAFSRPLAQEKGSIQAIYHLTSANGKRVALSKASENATGTALTLTTKQALKAGQKLHLVVTGGNPNGTDIDSDFVVPAAPSKAAPKKAPSVSVKKPQHQVKKH